MSLNIKEITELFRQNGLRVTPQRVAVYNFLVENRIHPDVDTVYKKIVADDQTFSKTTIYNCLKDLANCGLIIPVKIDSDKIRYDADTSFHGHFRCERCGKIYDFKCCENQVIGIEGFKVNQRDVYYSGICNCCNN